MAATRRITGSLIGTMGIVTLLPFVQLDGLWKCIYDTFPGAAAATFNAASFHIKLGRLLLFINSGSPLVMQFQVNFALSEYLRIFFQTSH